MRRPDVRYGSKADLRAAKSYVRFTPGSTHFVSPIEMPVYSWKLAGAATMRVLHKDLMMTDQAHG